ncbi:hypothetical protein BH18ACT1_BH18ACT1_09860 [soil metagenome]
MTALSSRTSEEGPTDGDGVLFEPSAAPPARRPRHRVPVGPALALAAVAALAVWGRLLDLTSSFWQDEAKPIWAYVDRGPGEILFGDYDIDNHILFNLLTWATTRVVGRAEVVYRMWSLIPALASAGLVVAWAWRRIGAWASVAVAAVIAVSPMHLDLAPQARAYGLTYLAFAGLLVCGDAYLQEHRRRDALLFGGAGFLGAASFPIFGLPFALTAVAVLVGIPAKHRRRFLEALVPWGLGLLAITANAVPQLLTSAGDFQAHRKLAPLGASEIVLWPHRLVAPSFAWAAERVPALRAVSWEHSTWEAVVSAALLYPLLVLGAVWLVRRGGWRTVTLLVLPVAGTYLLVVARGMALWPRYTSYFLYPTVLLLAAGLHALGTWLWHRPEARALALAGATLLLFPVLRGALESMGAIVAVSVLAVGGAALAAAGALPARGVALLVTAIVVVASVPVVTGFADGARSFDEPLREDWQAMAADLPESPALLAATRVHAGLVYYLGMPDVSLEGGNSRKRINQYDEVRYTSGKELTDVLCRNPGEIALVETAETGGRISLKCFENRGRAPRRSRYPMLLYGGYADLTVIPPLPSP